MDAEKPEAPARTREYIEQGTPLLPTDRMVHYTLADDLPPEIGADRWDKLRSLCRKYMSGEDAAKVERAYCFAAEKHRE